MGHLQNKKNYGIILLLLKREANWEAGLAQLVEQRIRNAKVGSSSLLTGTIQSTRSVERVFLYPLNPSR